ncbi:unnamed protein product [Trichobilharzia regenti]|nr:unnamed protein product [Trichobilharzia regenti]
MYDRNNNSTKQSKFGGNNNSSSSSSGKNIPSDQSMLNSPTNSPHSRVSINDDNNNTNNNNNNNMDISDNDEVALLMAHPLEEPKRVACAVCQKRFKNQSALNGHMRLHGGYGPAGLSGALSTATTQTPTTTTTTTTTTCSSGSNSSSAAVVSSQSNLFFNSSSSSSSSKSSKCRITDPDSHPITCDNGNTLNTSTSTASTTNTNNNHNTASNTLKAFKLQSNTPMVSIYIYLSF